jgi:hypothetical protein
MLWEVEGQTDGAESDGPSDRGRIFLFLILLGIGFLLCAAHLNNVLSTLLDQLSGTFLEKNQVRSGSRGNQTIKVVVAEPTGGL